MRVVVPRARHQALLARLLQDGVRVLRHNLLLLLVLVVKLLLLLLMLVMRLRAGLPRRWRWQLPAERRRVRFDQI